MDCVGRVRKAFGKRAGSGGGAGICHSSPNKAQCIQKCAGQDAWGIPVMVTSADWLLHTVLCRRAAGRGWMGRGRGGGAA